MPFTPPKGAEGCRVEWFYLYGERPTQKFLSKRQIVVKELLGVFKLLRHFGSLRNAAVYAVGGQWSCLLVHRLFGPLLGNAHFYYRNFYLHSLGEKKAVKRVLSALLNRKNITLLVQTPGEEEYFRNLSAKPEIIFYPYCDDTMLGEMKAESPKGDSEGYVFTGGYTNRDYELMAEVARMMPGEKFVIVKSKLNGNVDFPSNVEVHSDIDPEEFKRLLQGSKVVVVPLKEDVGASGQMLCLQAMRCAKPIVYANVSAISYYFTPSSGYPYEIGNAQSLHCALQDALSEKLPDAGANAQRISMKYTRSAEREMIARALGLQ